MRWIAGALAVAGVALGGAAGAISPETVIFRTHTHFKLMPPGDWQTKYRSSRVEHKCVADTDCEFIIDFGGQFTYTCSPDAMLVQFQGQLLVPGECHLGATS